jgi:hypothetical protein
MGFCPECFNGKLDVDIKRSYDLDNSGTTSLYLYCRINKDGTPGCGWIGNYLDTIEYEEAISKRRTKLIDKMLT